MAWCHTVGPYQHRATSICSPAAPPGLVLMLRPRRCTSSNSFSVSNSPKAPVSPNVTVPPNLVRRGTSLTPSSSEIGCRRISIYPHATTWDWKRALILRIVCPHGAPDRASHEKGSGTSANLLNCALGRKRCNRWGGTLVSRFLVRLRWSADVGCKMRI
jgi:hypothetical protein